MKIVLEAEVMDEQRGTTLTPSMYLPGHVTVNLRVVLAPGSTGQEFQQTVILRLDEVEGIYDLLMKNLTRNMRESLVSYLEDTSYPDRFAMMPVLTFKRMRS